MSSAGGMPSAVAGRLVDSILPGSACQNKLELVAGEPGLVRLYRSQCTFAEPLLPCIRRS
jgi:hypothetical protein